MFRFILSKLQLSRILCQIDYGPETHIWPVLFCIWKVHWAHLTAALNQRSSGGQESTNGTETKIALTIDSAAEDQSLFPDKEGNLPQGTSRFAGCCGGAGRREGANERREIVREKRGKREFVRAECERNCGKRERERRANSEGEIRISEILSSLILLIPRVYYCRVPATFVSLFSMERKLVVLGIPWDVDTDGLKEYMIRFGELEDCIVMKERATGRSRGFGYVTFVSDDDAKKALSSEHVLGNRMLEVKVATPKEEMVRTSSKKATRIFVARIPQSVNDSAFRSHFESYGEIADLYMPKDPTAKGHRGIGFITFTKHESVDNLMADTHELGGTTVDDDYRPHNSSRGGAAQGGYGAYNAYISAATRYAAIGAPTLYDHPGSMYGRGDLARGSGSAKIFVGRLPPEASVEDLRQYFGRFGRIMDVYVPKDPKRSGHRGFGFVTFADESVAERVARRPHEICGHQVAIDTATPLDDAGPSGSMMMDPVDAFGGYGPMRSYGRMYGSLDFDDWGYGSYGRSTRPPPRAADWRYRPY
ncbi:LOW QUALITY PROTEIN: hypothetical protein V2J09_009782 [Rumex salicifolius]